MPASANSPASWRRDLLLLALLFGALYFFRLGSYPLSNPDEGRNAEVPREMIASGDWVTPRLDGVNYFEKPPLVYWVTALSESAFGLNEWAVRAVPALFALAGILLTYAAARGLYGATAGRLSALVLGTCVLWFVIGHIPILDTAVSVFMSGTLFCFLLAVREEPGSRRRWLFMGLYACAALATLTKGLMGFLVTGAVMFLWVLVFNQWRRLRPLYLPTGVVLFLAIALPWHLLAAQRNETWFHRYIVFEHFLRFLTPVASRPGAWHYFVWVVIGGMIPWVGFLVPGVRDALRGGWGGRRQHLDTWFLVTWAGFIFLFFSVSKSKLAPYILPIFPALAVLAGRWLAAALGEKLAPVFADAAGSEAPAPADAAASRDRAPSDAAAAAKGSRFALRIFSFFCGLLAVAIAVVIVRPALVRMDATRAAGLRAPAIVLCLVLAIGGVVIPAVARRRGLRSAVIGIGVMMAVFYGALEFAAPVLSKPGTKELALWVKAHASPEDRIFHCYDFYQDFTFYAERVVGVVGSNHAELELEEDAAARASGRFISDTQLIAEWGRPGRIFLVVQKRKIEQVRKSYADALADWQRRSAAGGAGAAAAPERPVFADPDFHYQVVTETPAYLLVSNR